ncbi:ATP-binding protein [Rhizobium sp.]|uniref:ATP-binding protein n=1 Tax=Rhizobium sp. TaxID=391 RepID=UPI0028B0F226
MSSLITHDEMRNLMARQVDKSLLDSAAKLDAINDIYVERTEDRRFRKRLRIMVAHMVKESSTEGFAIAVTGPSGAGKSTLVNTTLDGTKGLAPFEDGYGNILEPCLRIDTLPSTTAKDLAAEIVRATGYSLTKALHEEDGWDLVRTRLRAMKIKLIFFDEFQHVVKGPKAKGMAHLTNQMKRLMQNPEWPIWVIFAGVPEMMDFVEHDEWLQTKRRVRRVELDNLEDRPENIEDMRANLEALAEAADLKLGFPVTDEFMRRLLHGGLWRFGMTIQLIKMAIEEAIVGEDDGDEDDDVELDLDHFVEAYYQLSGCTKKSNVFSADNWQQIRREVVTKNGAKKLTKNFKLLEDIDAGLLEDSVL